MRTCKFREDFTYPDTQFHFHIHKTNFPEWHDHDYWEFFIVLSGEIKQTMENVSSSQILSEGMGCLVHPWDKHKFVASAHNYQQLNIMVTEEYFKKLVTFVDPQLYDSLLAVNHPLEYEIDRTALEEIMKSVHILQTLNDWETDKFVCLSKLMWMDVIKIICQNRFCSNHEYPAWLNDFISKIRKPENISKSVSELCSLTYFSYSHLTRLFKYYTGSTLMNYLFTLRINYAAMLLRTTDMSILSISSHTGYDSLSHFIRIFKKRFNMTPKRYRDSFTHHPFQSSDALEDKPDDNG